MWWTEANGHQTAKYISVYIILMVASCFLELVWCGCQMVVMWSFMPEAYRPVARCQWQYVQLYRVYVQLYKVWSSAIQGIEHSCTRNRSSCTGNGFSCPGDSYPSISRERRSTLMYIYHQHSHQDGRPDSFNWIKLHLQFCSASAPTDKFGVKTSEVVSRLYWEKDVLINV